MRAFRSILVVVGLVAIAGCGASSTNNGGASCTPGLKSTPNAPGDPCPQRNTPCADQAHSTASSICQQDGTWAVCACDPPAAAAAGTCGNGAKDGPTEDCDGLDLGGAGCSSLMVGYTGTLLCHSQTCTYDTSMCIAGAGVGGNGGVGGSGG
jgi:hypothetical protein